MVAGVDRYYQIARCFRDEDLRADRQLEFTQLDIEMSFVDEEDVMSMSEELLIELARAEAPHLRLQATPFPRMSYAEAHRRFGTDKPDLRYGLEIVDLGPAVADSGFRVFSSTIAAGGAVCAICAPAAFARREIDALEDLAKQWGARGLAWLAFAGDGADGTDGAGGGVRGSVAKFLGPSEIAAIRSLAGVDAARTQADGDAATCLIVAGEPDVARECLGRLRVHLASELGLAADDTLAFCWITDPPLVAWNDDEDRWDAVHHPFTAPRTQDIALMETDPGAVLARAYDVVANGFEIGGGSVRMHQAELQARVFALLGIDEAQAEEEFGHLLEAFKYGAPPHGGIAWGFDRLVMLLAGETTIREVIPFPKTLTAVDPMTDAPSAVPEAALEELGIAVLPEPTGVA